MTSFSFCEALDVCLEDAWNYIDYKCASKWIKGKKMDIFDCFPTETECPSFTSSESVYGVWTNTTISLATTEYCQFVVDGTKAVARVVFSNGANYGIVGQYKYEQDEVVTVEDDVLEFIVYNADSSGGTVSFTLAFTGGVQLLAGLITWLSLSLYVM
mmetsp:Transcript_11774/g.11702  ORF Transcript_11774/g.11702 Transcript_11774/m.11702 type:complete len:157 (+) Transcript_11774:161-631(+)|eukprot:CAMPEP_0170556282 /NCGR_PEP_ID=MMETSP0211-20121228/16077_1 /TAXON_ID=311385 /ORGANISM="Pseudokeronopsis sp., Strain OXSARD2" /LENGTH=156 /DNA_ID=CAMNT_0010866523 /DNA_START=157 /DNA_END=627 /DNA_ORIENTATION=-